MNETLTSTFADPNLSSPTVVVGPGVADHPTVSDPIARVEATFAQIDHLWAELDRGEFQIQVATPRTESRQRPERVARPAASRHKTLEEARALANFTLSVVIPVYNERGTILEVIDRVRQLPCVSEVVVVDDCSTDGTAGWLETVRNTPKVKLVLKRRNEGKGAALRTGFGIATGDIVMVQDADLEYDPRDIPDVIRPIVLGKADVVYGSRYLGRGGDSSWLHRAGNWLLTNLANRLNGTALTDMETAYKAFRRDVLQKIPLTQDRFGFEPEVTAKLARRRFRIREVPIQYQPRGYAEGKKIGLRDLANTLFCIARYGLAD